MDIPSDFFTKEFVKVDEAGDESMPLLKLAGNIVASYVHGNKLKREEIVPLMDEVYAKLEQLASNEQDSRARLMPAVPVEESVTDDYIYCLEDGKPFKMLKKHLMSVYGMTPEDYRLKWRLSPDYPMVAPNYAARRQELAKQSGLGRKRS